MKTTTASTTPTADRSFPRPLPAPAGALVRRLAGLGAAVLVLVGPWLVWFTHTTIGVGLALVASDFVMVVAFVAWTASGGGSR